MEPGAGKYPELSPPQIRPSPDAAPLSSTTGIKNWRLAETADKVNFWSYRAVVASSSTANNVFYTNNKQDTK